MAHMWTKCVNHPGRLGGCPTSGAVTKTNKWLRGPHVGKMATSPLPPWGSRTLRAGRRIGNGYMAHMRAKWLTHPCRLGGPGSLAQGQNSGRAMWHTCGQSGSITPAVLGLPNAQRTDINQKWLCGTHVGKVVTSYITLALVGVRQRLPWGQKSETAKWPTCGRSGYINPAVLGVPTAQLNAGTQIGNVYIAHMWAKWLHHPCRLGGPQRLAWGQKSQMARWPTCGQSGYITPAVLGVPHAQRGDKNQKWLRGAHVGKVPTSPMPSCRSPTLSARTKFEMATWPICGQTGYITPAVLVVP